MTHSVFGVEVFNVLTGTSSRCPTIRSAALPSHLGGIAPAREAGCSGPFGLFGLFGWSRLFG
jgi:hypothetical protein